MKKIIVILISILVVSVIAGGAYIWYLMQQPLYEPGMVRAEENLRAPLRRQRSRKAHRRVEADIDLFRFAEGEGRNVLIVHGARCALCQTLGRLGAAHRELPPKSNPPSLPI